MFCFFFFFLFLGVVFFFFLSFLPFSLLLFSSLFSLSLLSFREMGTIRKTISIRSLDDDIDFDLVSKFYNELIFPTFGGVAEHMDDLETWKDLLFSPSPPTYRLFLDIVVIENESKIGDNDGHSSQQQQQKQQIIGGSMFEFFPNSLCGILSYIVVHELHRGRGIAQSLVHQMKDTLNQYATEITEGKEKKIRHLFLETNLPPLEQNPNIFSDSELIQLYKESLLLLGEHHHSESFEAWEKRMKFFSRLGFGVLDFPYIQPPLGEGKDPAFNLLLLAHMPSSPSPPLLLCDTTPSSQQQQQQQQKKTLQILLGLIHKLLLLS